MDALCDAIEARYAGSGGATLRGLVNGLTLDEVSPRHGIAAPYVRYSIISNPTDYSFGPKRSHTTRVQFTVVGGSSDTRESVGAIMAALVALYDFCAMTVSGYAHVVMKRENDLLAAGEPGWIWTVDYLVRLQVSG